jgi:hypothetical protein
MSSAANALWQRRGWLWLLAGRRFFAQPAIQITNLPPFGSFQDPARFAVPSGTTHTTRLFTWETNRVSFQSFCGGYSPSPPACDVISSWTCTLNGPPSGDENARINLWPDQGQGRGPSDSNAVEIAVRRFDFVPFDSPQPAQLAAATRLPNGQARFIIGGRPDANTKRRRPETWPVGNRAAPCGPGATSFCSLTPTARPSPSSITGRCLDEFPHGLQS